MENVILMLSATPTVIGVKTLKVIPLKLFYYQTFFETWCN